MGRPEKPDRKYYKKLEDYMPDILRYSDEQDKYIDSQDKYIDNLKEEKFKTAVDFMKKQEILRIIEFIDDQMQAYPDNMTAWNTLLTLKNKITP